MKPWIRNTLVLAVALPATAGIVLAARPTHSGAGRQQRAAASEQVDVITFNEAPVSVRDGFAAQTQGAKPERVERIRQEGVTKYEIEYAGEQGVCSLTLSDGGQVLESEKAVKLSSLPEAALRELKKDYPGARFAEAEAVELHYFEVEVVKDGKKRDVIVLATGDIEDQVFGGGDEDDADHADRDDEHHGRRRGDDDDEEDDDD